MQDKVKMTFLNGEERDVEDVLDCIGPGWRPLVRKLILDLFAEGWEGELAQVKEKFGGLRFYADNVPAGRGEELIYEAEEASLHICEECGQPGELRTRGWWMTLCDEHATDEDIYGTSEEVELREEGS